LEKIITQLLTAIGEDPAREGLVDTPKRVAKALKGELLSGYGQDPSSVFTSFTNESYDEVVLLRDIEFYSMCEHHMLPFFGKATIAYLPTDKVVGISKLARLLDIYSKRLQIQERLTVQITKAIEDNLNPQGAACIIEAQHFCMIARGVKKQNSVMVTSSLTGIFLESGIARNEIMTIFNNRR
jgi:GTP cyclohydrolase I